MKFIKTYLEYNQLQLQTLDIIEFFMSQCKLSRCILFLYKSHDEKKKHDKRLLNSATSAINMDGHEKIITVTSMVPKSAVLITLSSYLLLVTRYHNHHHQTVLFLN